MENETAQVRILASFFFFFFFSRLYMCRNVMKGLFFFLHIVAKSPSAFPK